MQKQGCYLAVLLAWPLLVQPGFAQQPSATGREIQLSNPAWKLFIPDSYRQRPGKLADVLIHFHGHPQTVWDNSDLAGLNAILVTVNYRGRSGAYSKPFSDKALFQSLLDQSLAKVRLEGDFPDALKWDRVCVSSFSAGYGAIREILKNATYRKMIDGVLLADSLYASTAADGTPLDAQMVDFKSFADLAKRGKKTFLLSHSQVLTHTYENTMETADELLEHLELTADPVSFAGLGTLDFYRHAKSGKFHLWGALGDDGEAHMGHLRYMAYFLKQLPLARLPDSEDR